MSARLQPTPAPAADALPAAPPGSGAGIDPAFLSSLAHELRNPLAPLVNALFLLRARIGGDADATWALDIVDRQVADLRVLLDDTSDIARLLRGHLPASAQRVAVADVLTAAADAARPALSVRRQTIGTAASDAAATVPGERARLVRAVSALLVHVGRAGAQGDALSLAVDTADPRWVTLIVEGPIPASAGTAIAAPESFESGVGVALADAVARWHGGTLVQHAADGHLRCELRLPRAPRGEAVSD